MATRSSKRLDACVALVHFMKSGGKLTASELRALDLLVHRYVLAGGVVLNDSSGVIEIDLGEMRIRLISDRPDFFVDVARRDGEWRSLYDVLDKLSCAGVVSHYGSAKNTVFQQVKLLDSHFDAVCDCLRESGQRLE